MSKKIYFLFVIFAVLGVAVAMIFYPAKADNNREDNITFRKATFVSPHNAEKQWDEDGMTATLSYPHQRNVDVAKYVHKGFSQPAPKSVVKRSYLSGEVNVVSPRATLNGNSVEYRRYAPQQMGHQVVGSTNVLAQQLNVRASRHNTDFHRTEGVVAIGNSSAVSFNECTHESVEWSQTEPFGICNGCGGKAEITTDLNGDGALDMDDVKWTPLGDSYFVFLLMALVYVIKLKVEKL